MTAVPVPFAGTPRVNLMPRSEVARRDRDKLVRLWVWIVFGAVIIAFLIIGGAFAVKYFADQRLAAEQAHTNALLIEIASLSDVSQALATEAELTDFRAEAMETDLVWTPVIAEIIGVLPSGAALTGMDFVVGGAQASEDPTIEPGLSGQVTVESPTPLDIVTIIRSLRGVEAILYADGQALTLGQVSEGSYAYVLNVEFDQTVYSNQYATEEGGE